VNLKPKLRGTAQVSRQYYRGERWYVVRDAASNQFHRLSDTAYRFIGLLDGSRTVGEAWDLVGGQLADDAPTQPEVIQILSQLYAANLVETDIPPDSAVLLRRHKKQMQRKMQGRLMNVLFPRIPIWDCDRFLVRWMPLARIAFSRIGAIIWLLVVGLAIAAVAPQWQDLKTAAAEAVNIKDNWENAFYLWAVFVAIKFIHECGHAFGCRRFGGECHEMGIMFLVFIPTPYVDASTAWAFPSRWQRIFVGAAGMIVELFVASLCAFIWLATKDSHSLVSHLAYNAMLIASVSTVVFNANPLLRYDGYYMLSDWLEIPNLQMKSREYLMGLIKRHVFRLKPTQPLPPTGQRVLLFFYGIASTCYRVFVGVAIILMVTWQIPILGVLMGLGGLITWLVMPLVKLFKYLTIEPELHRKRGRGWAFSLGVAAAAVLLFGLIPFPMSIYASGVIEPSNKSLLKATTPGWVRKISGHDGEPIKKDDVIAVLVNPEIELKIAQAEAKIRGLEASIRQAQVTQTAQKNALETSMAAEKKQLAIDQEQQDKLTIRAPFDGILIAPELNNFQDRYLERGTEIATVAAMDKLLVKAVVEQRDAQLAFEFDEMNHGLDPDKKVPAEFRLVSRLDDPPLYGIAQFFPGASGNLPSQAMTPGGGEIPVDPRDQSGVTPLMKQFELRAELSNPGSIYQPGQTTHVRLKLPKRPLVIQWGRRFLQLLQQRSSSKWL
jgi:putative peptide zinc metalloprotease protein